MIRLAFPLVLVLGAIACASDPPPQAPTLEPPYPGKPGTWGAPNSYPPPGADAAAPVATPAPAPAPAPEPAPEPAAPPPIACSTTDDCWMDAAFHPIARPKKERGKKVTPCKGGEHAPLCIDAVCVVRAYKC